MDSLNFKTNTFALDKSIKARKKFDNSLPWKVKKEEPKTAYKRKSKYKDDFTSEY